jgi:hypothetical protein
MCVAGKGTKPPTTSPPKGGVMLLVAAPARNSHRPTLAGPPEAIPMMSNRAGIILCIAITPGMNGWVGGWEKRREGGKRGGQVAVV